MEGCFPFVLQFHWAAIFRLVSNFLGLINELKFSLTGTRTAWEVQPGHWAGKKMSFFSASAGRDPQITPEEPSPRARRDTPAPTPGHPVHSAGWHTRCHAAARRSITRSTYVPTDAGLCCLRSRHPLGHQSHRYMDTWITCVILSLAYVSLQASTEVLLYFLLSPKWGSDASWLHVPRAGYKQSRFTLTRGPWSLLSSCKRVLEDGRP